MQGWHAGRVDRHGAGLLTKSKVLVPDEVERDLEEQGASDALVHIVDQEAAVDANLSLTVRIYSV